MTRSFSESLLISVYDADNTSIGAELCKLCVKANLKSLYIVPLLGVTRMSVHSWFRGKPIRKSNRVIVEALMERIKKDLSDGVLPAVNDKAAKEYCIKLAEAKAEEV